MSGDSTSLSVLAAIANERRAALQLRGAMPLVQGATPLGRGNLPLLARQLLLPPKIPVATYRALLGRAPAPVFHVPVAQAAVRERPATKAARKPASKTVSKPLTQPVEKASTPKPVVSFTNTHTQKVSARSLCSAGH